MKRKTETFAMLIAGAALAAAILAAILLWPSDTDVSSPPSTQSEQIAKPEVQSGNISSEPQGEDIPGGSGPAPLGESQSREGVGEEVKPAQETTTVINENPAKEPSPVTHTVPAVSPQLWLFISLSAMAIATLAAVAISFYLYRWRRILLSQKHLTVPEEHGAWIKDLSKWIRGSTKEVASRIESIGRQSVETNQGIKDLSETFMTMQQALDEREKEIQRLKKGYDAHVYRKFVSRFIRVDQALEESQQDGGADQTGLGQIRLLLSDSFAECGVECFQPQIGEDYREADGVAEEHQTVKTDRPEDDFKIAEILKSGYQIRSAESVEVIMEARVSIYRFQEGEAS